MTQSQAISKAKEKLDSLVGKERVALYKPIQIAEIFVEKRNEGFWRNVKVYDGRDLEEWIEQAPPVGAWLARHLNISSLFVLNAKV